MNVWITSFSVNRRTGFSDIKIKWIDFVFLSITNLTKRCKNLIKCSIYNVWSSNANDLRRSLFDDANSSSSRIFFMIEFFNASRSSSAKSSKMRRILENSTIRSRVFALLSFLRASFSDVSVLFWAKFSCVMWKCFEDFDLCAFSISSEFMSKWIEFSLRILIIVMTVVNSSELSDDECAADKLCWMNRMSFSSFFITFFGVLYFFLRLVFRTAEVGTSVLWAEGEMTKYELINTCFDWSAEIPRPNPWFEIFGIDDASWKN